MSCVTFDEEDDAVEQTAGNMMHAKTVFTNTVLAMTVAIFVAIGNGIASAEAPRHQRLPKTNATKTRADRKATDRAAVFAWRISVCTSIPPTQIL